MPPEQWIEGGKVGTPADLYAFGLILSELLAGRHGLADLEAELDEEGWYQLHISGVPSRLRTGPAKDANRLPLEVEQLYQALLAKRPEDRPSAGQALTVLQQAAAQLGEDPYIPPEDYYPRTDEHRLMTWRNWAVTCASFERFEKALARNEQALAIDPSGCSVLITQANIKGALGLRARRTEDRTRLLEEALGWYDRALVAATTDIERTTGLNGRATHLMELGRYNEADGAFATALMFDANYGFGWCYRANNALRWSRAEVEAGRHNEAMRLYAIAESYAQEAQRVGLNHPNVITLLAEIQRERSLLES
jgi:tetratricopeptide (TPR) repeat protein